MKKTFVLSIVLTLAMLLTSLPMLACDFKFVPGEADKKVLEGLPPEFLTISQAWDLLQKNYVDKTKLDPVKMAQGAIRGMVAAVDDPYTEFFSPQSFESTMIDLTGLYQGIGAYIGKKDNQIIIISAMPGSPAEEAGLKSGDMILKIDGQSTAQLNTTEASQKIRGQAGTDVVLLVYREGDKEPFEQKITRREIKLDSVKFEMRGDLAYIRIQQFIVPTTGDFKKALMEANRQGAKGIILDLRDNPGGLLSEAVDVASQFLTRGIAVKVVDKNGLETVQKVKPGGIAKDLPVIVLVNKGSASASEIVAGALQDNGRAKLAGEKTFGKASVQNFVKLDDGSAIKMTTAHYYTPNGTLISGTGLTPDYPLDIKDEELIKWAEDYLNDIISAQPTPTPAE
ncbi:MAG: S41 family peptidase [Dehalococcoidia bacterium]